MKSSATETFLLTEALPCKHRDYQGDEALIELGSRYATGHGPVSMQDLMVWSKLSKTQATKALRESRGTVQVRHAGEVYWLAAWQEQVSAEEIEQALRLRLDLPAFDEYLLGYSNKQIIVPDAIRKNVLTANGLSWPWVMEGGVGVASLRAI